VSLSVAARRFIARCFLFFPPSPHNIGAGTKDDHKVAVNARMRFFAVVLFKNGCSLSPPNVLECSAVRHVPQMFLNVLGADFRESHSY